jgi:membrane dipeptidase
MKESKVDPKKVEEVHAGSVVVDGHNHLLVELTDRQSRDDSMTFEIFCAPLLARGGVNVMMTTIGGDNPCLTNLSDLMLTGTLLNMDEIFQEVKTNKKLAICRNSEEIDRALREKKLAILLSMEGARPLQGRPCLDSPALLRIFQRLGLSELQLVDNGRNWIGDGAGQVRTGSRLTPAGAEVIKEMNSLGMLIDVSHLNEEGFWDVIELSEAPIVASHSNARKICDQPRNLSDEQLKAISEKRGIVGIGFANFMVSKKKDPGLDDVIDHIKYIADLTGTDCIGLGPDFMGQVSVYPGRPGWLEGVYTGNRTKQSKRPDGLSDVSCFPRITQGLLESGFSEEETRKILGGNYLRLFKEVLK